MFTKIISLFKSEDKLRKDIARYVEAEFRFEDREEAILRLMAQARR